ncbi:STAS/SEC14 domain-containing protein [Candidatus Nitrospira allomarina]|uniref:STAS/SEC14 domain-containing protein n=1 Tax=Candidatus Nitrospira allomarina TaxID=3020900 RepID=A0AA96JUE5_9BACT|nr:STAS/SEC14 domain-containing protein [Candidatus Nitrospira allomarina]WNM60045.1 STAS/SEC14 domain-containing protein [Candidatus Nitrospira allomarina]
MYRILDESEAGSVGIRVEGKLSVEEYDLLNAYLEQLMQEVGPINFLCDLATLEGENGQALWEEMTDHLRNAQAYQRIAVVGNRRWSEGGPKVSVPWPSTQFKYFTPDQTDEAWHWVKG